MTKAQLVSLEAQRRYLVAREAVNQAAKVKAALKWCAVTAGHKDLLRRAIPRRYEFICSTGLKALPRLLKKGYAKVVNNENYLPAARRWTEEVEV